MPPDLVVSKLFVDLLLHLHVVLPLHEGVPHGPKGEGGFLVGDAELLKVVEILKIRAGHFRYFLAFSLIKNDFFALFIKLITYFCTSPI